MDSTSDIYTLLRLYGKKHHRTQISVEEFCNYLIKYAQHYVTEQPDLAKYTKTPREALLNELAVLASTNKVILKEEDGNQIIVISAYFRENVNARYKQMATNPSTPYPIPSDLPKDFPQELISQQDAGTIIYDLLDGKEHGENVIYSLVFRHEIAPVLLPQGVSADFLMQSSIAKLRDLMNHGEQHDYFLQKLMTSNGGRSLAVKNFFNLFTSNEEETIIKFREAGDCYYFLNQLFLFVRQDFEKIKDKTAEDVDLLQAVYISELCASYYKNKVQLNLQRDTALKNLELSLGKAPYYFDANAIAKFVDSRGVPLLGQYSEDDLNEYLVKSTTPNGNAHMPPLLTFKTEDDTRYFVLTEKTMPLLMKLCTEARKTVHDSVTKEWFGLLQRFQTVPAMKNVKDFDEHLEEVVKSTEPILHSLLNAPFLKTVYYDEMDNKSFSQENFCFFNDGELLPYSELLMLTPHSVLSDAKILLPVWYTLPGISFILSLFLGRGSMFKKSKNKKKSKKEKPSKSLEKKAHSSSTLSVSAADSSKSQNFSGSKKDEFKMAAASIEKILVPPDSSLDSELTSYLNEWNHLLDKEAKKNLTEDVNSLIRDYLRKILRTASPGSFTAERINELAETLVKTPALQKINDHANLHMYIQLYMLRLIKKA
ncbi:MAG: hypothetical protein MJ159_04070 [Treponemataceae bacterium]|nr:hypothetical protein [Treponemataceae bacterium]